MNRTQTLAKVLMVSLPLSALAMERQALEIIYTGPDTESAAPFFAEIEIKNQEMGRAVERSKSLMARQTRTVSRPMRVTGAEGFFPIQTTLLKLAKPQIKRVRKLDKPIFVIGMDRVSLTWLKGNMAAIQEIKAMGVVIEAKDFRRFSMLQSQAAKLGVEITAISGDALAQGYGISTYPTLLIGARHGR